jgi:hypothetical protein
MMRNSLRVLLAFLVFSFPLGLAAAPHDYTDPFSKFQTAVKAVKVLPDGAAQWKSLAAGLASDPLFASLGLDKLSYTGGNQLSYDFDLRLGEIDLDLKGTLAFDAAAADGQPVATLTSAAQSRTAADLVDIGALHATSASLEAAIYKEDGAYKIYARVIPRFTNYNKPPLPSLLLSKGKGGLDYTVVGGNLALKDIFPFAAQAPLYKQFAFESLSKSGTTLSVKGSVNGRAVTAAGDTVKDTLFVTGDALTAADFYPETAALPLLNGFAFDSFSLTAAGEAVTGRLNGKKVSVSRGADKKSFAVKGDDIKLQDFIPAASQVPCVNALALDSVLGSDTELAIAGKVNGKAVSVSGSLTDDKVEMSGPGLSLPSCIPLSLNLPFLKLFSFGGLFSWPDRLEVDGTVNGKDVRVVWIFAPNTVTVTGESIKLGDILPAAAKEPMLESFAFLSLEYSKAALKVNGKVSGKALTVTQDNAAKTFTVSGAGLTLADFIPETAGLTYLRRFELNLVRQRPNGVLVAGDVAGKAVTVESDRAAAAFTVTGDGLKLVDFVPEAAQIAFLDAFALDGVRSTPGEFVVTGKVNGKAVLVDDHITSNIFTVTGDGLKLRDFFPESTDVPALNNFAFESLTHTADGVTVTGKVNGKAVLVARAIGADTFTVKGDALKLADFVPAAAKVSYLNNFAFVSLTWHPGTLEVAGTVNAKNVTVTLDKEAKTYTASGSGLQLADFVPEAAKLPYLARFDLTKVQERPDGVLVAGDVAGKAVSVDYNRTAASFKVTGDGLQLKDFIPQAAGVGYLDNFKFEGLLYSASGIEVTGKVNDKAVTVKKILGAPDFSVTGDSLKLADFVPGTEQVPCVNDFALDRVWRSEAELGIAGKVNGKAVSISDSFADNSIQMSGPGLSLPACLPLSLNLPFLNLFSFGSLFHWPDRLEVNGTLNGKDVKLVWIFAPNTVTVTGDSIKLADAIPDAARVPFLNGFAFLELDYSKDQLAVSGTMRGKAVSVTQDNAAKTFKVTGDDLKLADFVPEAANVPFLKLFAFDALAYSKAAVTVEGKLNSKGVSVTKAFGADGSFTAKGEGLTLSDIVPEAAGLKAFDALALDGVVVSPAVVEVAGRLAGKAVKFSRTRDPKPVSTITADGLTLGDIYAPLAGLPAVNAVAMTKLSLDGSSVEAQARLNGVTVDVVAHAGQGKDSYTAVFFDTLGAATFVPAAQGHVVNDLALERALFIVQPAGSPARTVAAADLPGDLPKMVGWGGSDTLALSEGVNFAGWLNVAKSGALARAFAAAGLPAGSVLLKGTVAPDSFKSMTGGAPAAAASLSEADKQALLAGLNLSVALPLPSLPAIAGMVSVRGPVILSIGGDARGKSSLWANVPAPIAASRPVGDLDVSLQFGLDITGAGISEKLDALVSLDKGARAGYSLLAVYEGAWKQPFGIQGLTLDNGGFEFSLEKAGDQAKSGLAFFATAQIGAKNVAVTAQLKREGGKVSLDYFQLDGQFRPGDFPGGKNIPYGDKFELDELKLTPKGVMAKTVIAGKKVDAFLFDAGAPGAPNWVFAAAQKNFNVTELLPAAKAIKPLAAMTIPDAALIVSEKGLKNADRNSLGVIARDLFDRVLGKSAVKINIPDGIGVLAGFDAGAMGALGKGLSGLGVHDDAVVMGAVTGVFAGSPGVMLSITMDNPGDPKGLPKKVVSFKPGVPPSYFIQWSGTELDAGLRLPLLVKAGKETLSMDADLELKFAESGVGVKVLAEMDGSWRQPFGIKGLTLKDVKLDAAINETGEVQFGIAGDQLYGRCADPKSKDCLDVNMAMSVKIPLEDGLPDGVAFAGRVSQLSLPALMEITETLMGAPPGSLSKLPAPYFEIDDALLAFATPGASDPQLGLVSEGFAFGGKFVFMGKQLGKVLGSGGPNSGVKIKGDVADIDLEIIKFRSNSIDISLNADPKYVINSTVDLLGAPQKVKLDIEPPYFEFDMTEKLGAFGNALLTIRLDGFDLKKGTFDKNAGMSVVGEFKSTLVPWMKDEIKKGVEELRDSARAKFDEDLKALREAEKKVDELNVKIKKLKEEDQKAKDRAEEALDSARRRVDALWNKHDHEDHEAHHCGSRWTHWACSPGWRIAAAATWVVHEVAVGAFEAAKKAVAAATNLDPRVAALIAERDIERAGLSVAEAVVKVTEDVEDFVMKELETVLERAVSSLPMEIDKAIIVGDLKDMVTHNDPLVLDMHFKIAGAPMHEFFAVKVPNRPENLQFDAVSFALLPALGLDKLTEDALKKVSPDAARWVHAHIATKLAGAEEAVRKQVAEEEERFKGVLASFDNGTAKYKKAFEEQSDDHLKLVEDMDVTDLMPDSLQYSNIYLAIGHSNLCLAVSKDGLSVVQLHCKDSDVEQWSTVALKGDDEGYVELRNKGLCLKARKGDAADNFEPLILAACDAADLHQQWKIISSDGFYDEIVNRYSQKCLHFNTESANPESSFAVWTSCLGADSQTFRDITDAEKPTLHKVNAMLKAANGLCLDVVEATENSSQLTWDKREIKLYAHKCGEGSERFNYMEEVDGDIQLVHTETGGCVYPQEKADSLALRACDRGQDMFWRLNAATGSADLVFHPVRNSCMILPAPPKGSTQALEAGLANCNQVPNDALLMDFVK